MSEMLPITSVARRLRICLTDPINETVVRDSLRDVVTALEQRLDALRVKGGLAEAITESQPRLLRQLEGLEEEVSQVLTAFWEAQKRPSLFDEGTVEKLREMVGDLETVGEKERALLFESQVPLGGTN